MDPDDRVLVAVINRQRDLEAARQGWYRIPAARYVWRDVEYLAFFLSRAFGDDNGAVRWAAPVRGLELARRRDLLPDEAGHRRADEVYYRVAIGPLEPIGPIPNTRRRPVVFTHTTGALLLSAASIGDLYGGADYAVTRLYRRSKETDVMYYRRNNSDF
jgi:hypothetical protein